MTLWDVLRGVLRGAAVLGGLAAVVTVALWVLRVARYGRLAYVEVMRFDASADMDFDEA